MTHTTTDAAEARALTVTQADRDAAADLMECYRPAGWKNAVVNIRKGAEDKSYRVLIFARHRLATAEAASGAGEREDALEAAARAMCDRVNGIGDYDENIGQRRTGWLAQAKAGIAAYLASLPPATDPAMADTGELVDMLSSVTMEEGTAVFEHSAEEIGIEVMEHYQAVLAALAAAPTIPATGEAVPVIDAKMLGEVMQDAWGEICDDAGAHPLDMKHGRGSVLFYSPGQWTDLIALRLNERLPATGHAATEGEGA